MIMNQILIDIIKLDLQSQKDDAHSNLLKILHTKEDADDQYIGYIQSMVVNQLDVYKNAEDRLKTLEHIISQESSETGGKLFS
jgi:hypothetical protein